MMSLSLVIGLFAGLCTTFALIPQAIKIFKTKKTYDLSLYTYLISTCGLLLWVGYGFFLNDIPLLLFNSVSLAISGYILAMKLRYK